MTTQEFEKKREKWLKEVSEQCHIFAKETDIDYYVFQTPSNIYRPKLLIIGINPGGGKSYSEMLKCNRWDERPYTSLEQGVNILVEKPYWEKECGGKGTDIIRERLGRVFNKGTGLEGILAQSVFMNMFYFNTDKEADIDKILPGNIREIKNYCKEKTLEWIELSNPQNVLFLTSKLGISGATEIKSLGNFVKEGILNGRKVYSIPHYSYYRAYSCREGSSENAQKINGQLRKIIQ